MTTETAARPPQTEAGFKRLLGTPSLLMFGIAYMVPLAAFTTYGIVVQLTEGKLPLAYLITLVAILVTASSYGKMVRIYPNAGSSYAYATRSFGAKFGFVAGWSTLIDYLLLPMVCYLLIGIYMGAAFPAIPVWIWIVISLVATTAMNIIGIKVVNGANFALLAVQFVFIAIFLVLALTRTEGLAPDAFIEPFTLEGSSIGQVVGGAAILCFSFLGFDAISTLAEDAKNPKVTVPRAIILAPLIAGTVFIAVSYAGHLVFPEWQNFTDVDAAALDVIGAAGGKAMTAFFTAAYVAGCFAAALISQASVARILFSMGRDRMLPQKVFGRLSARFGSPVWSLLIVGAVSLLAIVLSLDFVSSVISFGALVAFTIVNIAVIKTYAIDRKGGAVKVVSHIVVPLLGGALTLWLWTSLSGLAFVTGLIWMGIGFLWIAWNTRMFTRPVPELRDV
ncbi:APC family permease [Leucobacter soli]|uniref:Putrescine importer PuuP n=1 Tax=Leucobacter soli TaxID=2812850 RepID=A0A916JZJ3_9MICO|nr:APC family permease [Leucobacter soli]CAG7618781.1 Putrescine importer PuuP [Leucobacter soli]